MVTSGERDSILAVSFMGRVGLQERLEKEIAQRRGKKEEISNKRYRNIRE